MKFSLRRGFLLFATFALLCMAAFTTGIFSFNSSTHADNNTPIQGGYGIKLDGTIPTTTGGTTPVSIIGQFDVFNNNTATGSRTLVLGGVGPIPGGNFTCQFTEVNSNGTGKLACNVVDAITGPAGRLDTFQYVLVNNRKEMRLTLISGVPGAVVSGEAIRQ